MSCRDEENEYDDEIGYDEDNECDLSLPVKAVEGLCGQETRRAIRSVCVPLALAQKGDVVAIIQDCQSMQHGLSLEPVTDFIIATGDLSLPYERTNFRNLKHAIQSKIAHGAILYQTSPIHPEKLWHAVTPLESGDGEPVYFNALITADFAIISVDEYQDQVIEGMYAGEDFDQDVIEACFIGLLYDPLTSAHEVIESAPLAEAMSALANGILPIFDPDDLEVKVPLRAPDLSEILRSAGAV